jgi:hypothetical protein
MQQLSGLGLIDRVLATHGTPSAMAGPPSFVVHPTAVLLVPDAGTDAEQHPPLKHRIERVPRMTVLLSRLSSNLLQVVARRGSRPSTCRLSMG